jgi:hypothetical protein
VRLRPAMLTWGELKRIVDQQLAQGSGDAELVKFIDWNGLDRPIVEFREDRGA